MILIQEVVHQKGVFWGRILFREKKMKNRIDRDFKDWVEGTCECGYLKTEGYMYVAGNTVAGSEIPLYRSRSRAKPVYEYVCFISI